MASVLVPDVLRVYEIYFAAFKNEQMASIILDVLFPGGVDTPEFRKAHAENTVKYWATNATQYTYKCIHRVTGDILGMLLCDVFLKGKTPEQRKNPGIPWLQGEQRERAENILNPLWEVRDELWQDQPHICEFLCNFICFCVQMLIITDCHVIAVDPKDQGRKAGAFIVKWGIEMGELFALPIYIESSPTTYGLYEKFGFSKIKKTITHKAALMRTEEDIVVPLMVKMPTAAGGISFDDWKDQGYPAWKR